MPGGFLYYAQEDPAALAVVDTDGTEVSAGELLADCNRVTRPEGDGFESATILAQRDFALGAAIQIIENRPRHTPLASQMLANRRVEQAFGGSTGEQSPRCFLQRRVVRHLGQLEHFGE